MNGMRGGTSKDLGRRAFGTSGGGDATGEAPGPFGDIIDLPEEIQRRPVVTTATRAWKPRAGRIYSFPVRTVPEEK